MKNWLINPIGSGLTNLKMKQMHGFTEKRLDQKLLMHSEMLEKRWTTLVSKVKN
jgi:hypothetical protein